MTNANGNWTTHSESSMHQICSLLNEIDICLILRGGYEPHVQRRPMTYQKGNLEGGLWFFGQANSRLSKLYSDCPEVTVAASCPRVKKCATLAGNASIVNHKPSFAHFYDSENAELLPDIYDPDHLFLLNIQVKRMDFWECSDGPLIHSTVEVLSRLPQMTPGGHPACSGHRCTIEWPA